MMRSPRYIALPIAGLCLMAACELVGLGGADDEALLVGPTWQLVAFKAQDGTTTNVRASSSQQKNALFRFGQAPYTISFRDTTLNQCGLDGNGQTENTQCALAVAVGLPNEASFSYEFKDGNALSLRGRGTTRIGLPPNSKESQYFAALDAATSYRIDGSRMRLAYGDGNALLFEAKAPASH